MMRPKVNSKQVLNHLLSHNPYEIQSTLTPTSRNTSKPIAGIDFENSEEIPKTVSDKNLPAKTDIPSTPPQKCCASEAQPVVEQKPSGPRYAFSTEIPDKYDDFYICVLPRDPQWLYVYWEFPDESKGSSEKILKKDSESAQWILRVKETPSELQKKKEAQFDVPISVTNNNWYVKIPEAGCNCVIEYGQLSNDGSFTPMASTSHFTPPSDSTVKNQSLDECFTTQSQQLIDFSCDTNAVQNIARFHDRSKTIPANRSNKETSDSVHTTPPPRPRYDSDGQEMRYFGSAAID